MAATFIKDAAGSNSGVGSIAGAFSGSITTGDVLPFVVGWSDPTATLSGVAKSSGTATLSAATILDNPVSSGNNHAAHGYLVCTAGGTCTVTASFSSTVASQALIILHDVTGVNTVSPLDGHAINPQTSNAGIVTSGNIITVDIGDYIFGWSWDCSNNASSIAAGSGYNLRYYTSSNVASEDQNQASPGSIAATFAYTGGSGDTTLTGVIAFSIPGGAPSTGGLFQGAVIFDLDSDGFPVAELQTGTNA